MLCTYTIFKVQVYALSVEMCNFWTIIINLDHTLNLSVVIPYSTINEIPDAKKNPDYYIQ